MVAIATAAGTYRWLSLRSARLLAEQRETMQAEIDELNSQVENLSSDLAALEADMEGMAPVAGSGRTMEICEHLNADAPRSTIEYRNESRGIAVQFPYNESWGYGTVVPAPYQELSGVDGVLFGRPRELMECQWGHTLQLTFLPPRGEEGIAADILRHAGSGADTIPAENLIQQETIGAHTFSVYRLTGYCLLQNFELAGERYSYVFSACVEDSADLRPVLETVELL